MQAGFSQHKIDRLKKISRSYFLRVLFYFHASVRGYFISFFTRLSFFLCIHWDKIWILSILHQAPAKPALSRYPTESADAFQKLHSSERKRMKKKSVCPLCGEAVMQGEPYCPNCRARLARAGVTFSCTKSKPARPPLLQIRLKNGRPMITIKKSHASLKSSCMTFLFSLSPRETDSDD